ncbi:MAG: FHA domain-containing protein [Chloroflexota bacterium]
MSIICPNCNHEEPAGALFCSECSVKLITSDGLSTATIKSADPRITQAGASPPPPPPAQVTESQVSLHIVRTGQILPLIGRLEFTLGRISQGQSILPDIDLSPYNAYAQGVSRLHATLKLIREDLYVEDLGSSNGTRINNTKIPPHKNQPVTHGDVITLGRFKIQALIRQE